MKVIALFAALVLISCKEPSCIVSGRYADGTRQTFEVVLDGPKDRFCEGVPYIFDFEVIDECYCK